MDYALAIYFDYIASRSVWSEWQQWVTLKAYPDSSSAGWRSALLYRVR
ncbi:hypothetical protein AB4Z50_08680 [Paenibacillus sp. 2TAB26]